MSKPVDKKMTDRSGRTDQSDRGHKAMAVIGVSSVAVAAFAWEQCEGGGDEYAVLYGTRQVRLGRCATKTNHVCVYWCSFDQISLVVDLDGSLAALGAGHFEDAASTGNFILSCFGASSNSVSYFAGSFCQSGYSRFSSCAGVGSRSFFLTRYDE